MKIYLDVCCLNRPFDDHTQNIVRIEAEAILTIISMAQTEKWILLNSEVIEFEISKIPDQERKQKVALLAAILQDYIVVNDNIEKRAIRFEKLSFGFIDALHIACAEKGDADIFLTTDDKLMRKALKNKKSLKIRVDNPIQWLMEVTKNDY